MKYILLIAAIFLFSCRSSVKKENVKRELAVSDTLPYSMRIISGYDSFFRNRITVTLFHPNAARTHAVNTATMDSTAFNELLHVAIRYRWVRDVFNDTTWPKHVDGDSIKINAPIAWRIESGRAYNPVAYTKSKDSVEADLKWMASWIRSDTGKIPYAVTYNGSVPAAHPKKQGKGINQGWGGGSIQVKGRLKREDSGTTVITNFNGPGVSFMLRYNGHSWDTIAPYNISGDVPTSWKEKVEVVEGIDGYKSTILKDGTILYQLPGPNTDSLWRTLKRRPFCCVESNAPPSIVDSMGKLKYRLYQLAGFRWRNMPWGGQIDKKTGKVSIIQNKWYYFDKDGNCHEDTTPIANLKSVHRDAGQTTKQIRERYAKDILPPYMLSKSEGYDTVSEYPIIHVDSTGFDSLFGIRVQPARLYRPTILPVPRTDARFSCTAAIYGAGGTLFAYKPTDTSKWVINNADSALDYLLYMLYYKTQYRP